MNFERRALAIFVVLFSIFFKAQVKPIYPEPQKGSKLVVLDLPKLENEKDYKVEIVFAMEYKVSECAVAHFNFPEIETKYLAPPARWPYYVINGETIEVIEGVPSDANCTSSKRVFKKILSSKQLLENYSSDFKRYFYIPEDWTLEYRTWKVSSTYKTIK